MALNHWVDMRSFIRVDLEPCQDLAGDRKSRELNDDPIWRCENSDAQAIFAQLHALDSMATCSYNGVP
jgi:hypothetical protein